MEAYKPQVTPNYSFQRTAFGGRCIQTLGRMAKPPCHARAVQTAPKMSFDFSRVDYVVLGLGILGWLAVLGLIWSAPSPSKPKDPFHLAKRYFSWRALHSQAHQDGIRQFLVSDEVHHSSPPDKWGKALFATSIGAVALLYALDYWGVFQ